MSAASQRMFLTGAHLPDEEVETRLIHELDQALGHPPRETLPPGTLLFGQDEPISSIWILVNGKVSLCQTIDGREVIFHSETVGRIIGLLSYASKNRSFFSCKAVTPITVMRVRFDDLDRALQSSPDLLVFFVTVLLRSLARRNRRLVELQTEVLTLNKTLAAERDQLARTLDDLQRAQTLLVESEKMATLGQMSAGIAHELNNPAAAIARSAEFIHQDLLRLSEGLADGAAFAGMVGRVMAAKPVSTRDERAARSRLEQALGDEATARRLAAIGIHSPDEFHLLTEGFADAAPAERLERLELFHQVAASLRNIDRCAERIAGLVQSLRSYTRADDKEMADVDVREGLEDTLRLFGSQLHNVEVLRHYGDVPLVRGYAGQLNQIWTNLIANALEAMGGRGQLTVEVRSEISGSVDVHIIDSGPGIPSAHLARIFDLRFTTRQGRVEFGLGLGLSICRNIAARHGGEITVDSKPGHTDFRVRLPASSAHATPNPEKQP